MDVKIKRQTKLALWKNPDMRTHPCIIMIKGDHNHHTQTASALKQLRVLPETKEKFFKYFEFGFCLLKKVLGEDAFYGHGHPNCFITDNSEAERKALRTTWPDSQLFLCIFHVLQQVWRWLCDGCHAIKKEDRPQLMKSMRQLVYAESEAQFEQHWNTFSLSHAAQQYNQYTRYLSKLVERKQEWCIASRQGYMLRWHQTNNFAESSMCIIKDIILNRCKAYNTSQLIIFINEIYDNYMKQRLLDVALARRRTKPLVQSSIAHDNILQVCEYKFTVRSETNIYNVDLAIGLCDCVCGQTGAACKHQVACAEAYLLQLPQVFTSTPEHQQWLAGVAVGRENMPPLEFFADLQNKKELPLCNPTHPTSDSHSKDLVEAPKDPATTENTETEDSDAVEINDIKLQEIVDGIKDLQDTICRVISNYGDDLTPQAMATMVRRLKLIKSSNQFNSFLCLPGSSATTMPGAGRGRIPCQPTSVARHKAGVPRGAAPIGKGRKRKGNLVDKNIKRQRNLSQNILNNQPNAKSHG